MLEAGKKESQTVRIKAEKTNPNKRLQMKFSTKAISKMAELLTLACVEVSFEKETRLRQHLQAQDITYHCDIHPSEQINALFWASACQ